MGVYGSTFARLVADCKTANTATAKGVALESLAAHIFGEVDGVEVFERNVVNDGRNQEIDLALWNLRRVGAFEFLDPVLLVECKNWESKVGSKEVVHFKDKLKSRSAQHGILIAANGVTGDSADRTAAKRELERALEQGIRILVLTLDDVSRLKHTDDLIRLLQRRICQLVVGKPGFT